MAFFRDVEATLSFYEPGSKGNGNFAICKGSIPRNKGAAKMRTTTTMTKRWNTIH